MKYFKQAFKYASSLGLVSYASVALAQTEADFVDVFTSIDNLKGIGIKIGIAITVLVFAVALIKKIRAA